MEASAAVLEGVRAAGGWHLITSSSICSLSPYRRQSMARGVVPCLSVTRACLHARR